MTVGRAVVVFHFVRPPGREGPATAPLPLPRPGTSFPLALLACIGARIEGCKGRSSEGRTGEREAGTADRGDGVGVEGVAGVDMLDILIAASVMAVVVGGKGEESF